MNYRQSSQAQEVDVLSQKCRANESVAEHEKADCQRPLPICPSKAIKIGGVNVLFELMLDCVLKMRLSGIY